MKNNFWLDFYTQQVVQDNQKKITQQQVNQKWSFLDWWGFLSGSAQFFDVGLNLIQTSNDDIMKSQQKILKKNQELDQKLDNQTIEILAEIKKELSDLRKEIKSLKEE